MSKNSVFITLIILLFLGISFYKLQEIPGEWWGDISIVHDYVTRINSGIWPLYFEAGGGPAYHYLIAPLIHIIGHTFTDYKIISTIVAVIGIVEVYLLTAEFFSKKTGLIAAAITSLSFWFFVWSRTGNYNIFVVNLSAGSAYFVLHYFRLRKLRDLFFGGLISSLGLLTYPGTFLLPIIFLLMLSYGYFNEKKVSFVHLFSFAILGLMPGIIVFIMAVTRDPAGFFHGYIGSKLENKQKIARVELVKKTLNNIYLTAMMFHFEGDGGFRINVPKSSTLDWVSGIFLLLGIIFWLRNRKKHPKFAYLLIPLLTYPIPSILPTHPPGEVPNSLRVLGTLPYIMLLTAAGITFSYHFLSKIYKSNTALFYFLLFYLLAFLNIHKYFVEYPPFLPNKNTPFGKIISDRINSIAPHTTFVIDGCCWGDWGQPEPKGILAELKGDRKIIFFAAHDNPNPFDCDEAKTSLFGEDLFIVVSPYLEEDKGKIRECFPGGREAVLMANGFTVAWTYLKVAKL